MIRHLTHTEIDKARWDLCISNAGNSLIYAFSWYLDTVCPLGWDALVRDDYDAVFPLPCKKKAGIRYIYTPFFVQQLGGFAPGPAPFAADDFLAAIPDDFRLVELALNSGNIACNKEFSFSTHLNHELDLNKQYDELRKNYSENLIRNIRRGEKHAVSLVRTQDPDKLIKLFRKEKGREIRHWQDEEYRILENLTTICRRRGELEIWEAYSADQDFIAGMMMMQTAKRAIFIFSATGRTARETGAMPLLIDHFIKENSETEKVLDFEGSNDPMLARFYKSFGAREVTYSFAVKNKLPWLINFLKRHFR